MIGYGFTVPDVQEAVRLVNRDHRTGNLMVEHAEDRSNPKGPRCGFKLTVVRSRDMFGRLSWQGTRRIRAACWHAHGFFFDLIFASYPDARMVAYGETITAGTVWRDWNIGSYMAPCWYSQACDCGPLIGPADRRWVKEGR